MSQPKTKKLSIPDRKIVWDRYQKSKTVLERLLFELYLSLQARLEEQDCTPTIKYRVKGFESYFNKITSSSRDSDEKAPQIKDLLGMRVICPFLEDLNQIEQIILKHYDVVEHVHKSENLSFREFGYDSVHLLIRLDKSIPELPYAAPFCEIQLRTILQDAWAEVEHELIYKSDLNFPKDSIKRKLASLNASLTLSDLIFQEIRDYQKELRRHGMKRRQSVEEILNTCRSVDGFGSGELKFSIAEEIWSELDQEETPRSLEKLMFRALEAHSNKNYTLAIHAYGRILKMKLDPTIRSLIHNHRGMALFALADYQKAVDDFGKAIKHNKDNIRAWCNFGLACRILGRHDLSLEHYQHALQIDATSLEAYWGRAQTYFELQRYTESLEDCEMILALQNDFAPAQELRYELQKKLN